MTRSEYVRKHFPDATEEECSTIALFVKKMAGKFHFKTEQQIGKTVHGREMTLEEVLASLKLDTSSVKINP
jgi:hypothetical protein